MGGGGGKLIKVTCITLNNINGRHFRVTNLMKNKIEEKTLKTINITGHLNFEILEIKIIFPFNSRFFI
jgi:hypothetical protein